MNHFFSKIQNNFPENSNITLSFEKNTTEKKLEDFDRKSSSVSKYTYSELLKINSSHNEYVKKLANGRMTLPNEIFYRMELIGAKVTIINGNLTEKGIIQEEKKNVIRLVTKNDKLKTYIKKYITIVFEYNLVKYYFIGENMRKNRFIKK